CHPNGLAIGSIMIVEIRRHINPNHLRLFLVHEVVEVLSHKRFHLCQRQLRCHVRFSFVTVSGSSPVFAPDSPAGSSSPARRALLTSMWPVGPDSAHLAR